ncbi:MAG: methyltransferase domain-containing protein [Chloroflexi bacterium]|nr:MAG: methyltransferase domain-containing protein [Chloroflexota bacterium]TMG42549.1 MAG: methyltransferase domain-containing protein [Chloroflexota bacterium]
MGGRATDLIASLRTRRWLLPLVFISGMASLGVEFGAARLLAPYFGTSLYVWGVLIGLILIYLSAGYVIGGRLADRHPRDEVLYQITAWAGLWIGIIPLVSYPILLMSQQGFKELSVGLVAGTLLAVVLLFAAPVILLGCVSPFAIRLLLRDVETGGNTAGRVYALSTAGSILGTFLPVFWFIPSYGTRPTLEGFGLALVGISIAGLWPRRRLYASFAAAVIIAWIFLPSGIKPPQVGQLLYEKESAYHYIQVVQDGSKTELILNEGEAIHSIYDSQSLQTGGPWDYMVVADSFRPTQGAEVTPTDVAILGLAGGTAARQYTAAFGTGVQITGVEIDPDILDVARRYFHLDEPNVHPVVGDARYWLNTQARQYDVVVMDAYRQPYIPFHLTTREFFSEVRDHLRPGGVAVVNAGRTATDYRLVDAIASTMAAVYPSVFLVDVPAFNNTLVYGTTNLVTLDDVRHNLGLVSEPFAGSVAQSVLNEGDLRVSPYHDQVFTDDLAPVERLIDEIIFGYVTGR